MSQSELGQRICSLVEECIKPTTPTKSLADWLTSAVWLFGPEVGDIILENRLRWIESPSLELAVTGLQMDEFFPASNRDELDKILNSVVQNHPALEHECEKIRLAFTKQFGG